jgi:D-serine deaminase-like pyridoxal phosphate-dependent protein
MTVAYDMERMRHLVTSSTLSHAPTPAVLIDMEVVEVNIRNTLSLLGSPRRLRPHIKTGRVRWTVERLLSHGVSRFKASTTSEVELLLSSGVRDVVLAFPAVGPTQWRLAELAAAYPEARVAALVDHPAAVQTWKPGPVSAFLDVDTGGLRTGVPLHDEQAAAALISVLREQSIEFRGLHSYDGHLADMKSQEKESAVTKELHDLVALARGLTNAGHQVEEIIAGGSHTFIPAAGVALPSEWQSRLTLAPGTVVYNDGRSLERFGDIGYRCAAFVLARVISHQGDDGVTLDAGLTSIQVDAGRPHAQVLRLPTAEVLTPSQEHLKVSIGADPRPAIGEILALVPRHLDTTIAQFDRVYLADETGNVWSADTVRRPF